MSKLEIQSSLGAHRWIVPTSCCSGKFAIQSAPRGKNSNNTSVGSIKKQIKNNKDLLNLEIQSRLVLLVGSYVSTFCFQKSAIERIPRIQQQPARRGPARNAERTENVEARNSKVVWRALLDSTYACCCSELSRLHHQQKHASWATR